MRKLNTEPFINKQYGDLTILSDAGQGAWNATMVVVRCSCGVEQTAALSRIIRGKKKSCGCKENKTIYNPKHLKMAQEMIGKKFGKLTVICLTDERKSNNRVYECLCECGNKKNVMQSNLVGGTTKSCGCYAKTTSNFQHLFRTYRRAALARKLIWDLSEEQFGYLTKQNCAYCGSEPNQIVKNNKYSGHYIYNGIDRKDNNVGYTIENALPCCKFCNYAKFRHTHEEFIAWVKRAYNHLQSTQTVLELETTC